MSTRSETIIKFKRTVEGKTVEKGNVLKFCCYKDAKPSEIPLKMAISFANSMDGFVTDVEDLIHPFLRENLNKVHIVPMTKSEFLYDYIYVVEITCNEIGFQNEAEERWSVNIKVYNTAFCKSYDEAMKKTFLDVDLYSYIKYFEDSDSSAFDRIDISKLSRDYSDEDVESFKEYNEWYKMNIMTNVNEHVFGD